MKVHRLIEYLRSYYDSGINKEYSVNLESVLIRQVVDKCDQCYSRKRFTEILFVSPLTGL